MPPKISLVSSASKKRKREDHLTQPPQDPEPNASSPSSSHLPSTPKKLKLNFTPKSSTNTIPTSPMPPKLSLFSRFTKQNTQLDSQPFHDKQPETSTTSVSSSKKSIKLKLTPKQPPHTNATSNISTSTQASSQAASAIGATPMDPFVIQETLEPDSPPIVNGKDSVGGEDDVQMDAEMEADPAAPLPPCHLPPALLLTLRAADSRQLSQTHESLNLLKMQLSWASQNFGEGMGREDLKGLEGEVRRLEKRGRRLEKKLGGNVPVEEDWEKNAGKTEEGNFQKDQRKLETRKDKFCKDVGRELTKGGKGVAAASRKEKDEEVGVGWSQPAKRQKRGRERSGNFPSSR